MASVGSPVTQVSALPVASSPAVSTVGLASEQPRGPEVLVVCMIHDSYALRARLAEIIDTALMPLFSRYATLHENCRVFVGGVVYRYERSSDLETPHRPSETVLRVPVAPASLFRGNLQRLLHVSPLDSTYLLDEQASTSANAHKTQNTLPEALAGVLEMLDSRDKAHLSPFARSALRADSSAVASRHLIHVVAAGEKEHGVHNLQRVAPADLTPLLNTQSQHDGANLRELVARLAARSVAVLTLFDRSGTHLQARSASQMLNATHAALLADDNARVSDVRPLLGSHWRAEFGIDMLATDPALERTPGKRTRSSALSSVTDESAPAAKRANTAPSPKPSIAQPDAAKRSSTPAQVDQSLLKRVHMLQQQQSSMLKSLAQYEAGRPADTPDGRGPEKHVVEQLKQRRAYCAMRRLLTYSACAAEHDPHAGRAAARRRAAELQPYPASTRWHRERGEGRRSADRRAVCYDRRALDEGACADAVCREAGSCTRLKGTRLLAGPDQVE